MAILSLHEKNHLCQRLLAMAFDKTEEKRRVAGDALAHRVVAQAMSTKERELLATLPSGWLEEFECIFVRVGYTEPFRLDFIKPVPLPQLWHNRERKPIAVGSTLGKALLYWQREYKDLRKSREELRSKISALVYNVRTRRQLRDRWPEAAAVLDNTPMVVKAISTVETAAKVSELNTVLGLGPAPVPVTYSEVDRMLEPKPRRKRNRPAKAR